jgi:membrane-associated PAP2 superfamily phosphatase
MTNSEAKNARKAKGRRADRREKSGDERQDTPRIGLILLALLLCLVVFQLSPLDLWLQDRLYVAAGGHWLWNRGEPVSRLLLYTGLKGLLIVIWIGIGVMLTSSRWIAQLRPYQRGLRIVFVSLLLVPLSVAALKAGTDIACPKDLIRYGGDVVHVGILPVYPEHARPATQQMCFPASHASSGFALLSLFFLFRSRANRRRAIALALLVGGAGGAYKMAIGDHFLSHTIVSLVLAWLIVNVVARAEAWLYGRERAVEGYHARA